MGNRFLGHSKSGLVNVIEKGLREKMCCCCEEDLINEHDTMLMFDFLMEDQSIYICWKCLDEMKELEKCFRI